MKIAIYCVTYHTYQELDAYLSNIEERLQGCTQIELSVNVCDNTEGEICLSITSPKDSQSTCLVSIETSDTLGEYAI